MAEERMLNNRGRKIVRERVGGPGGPTQDMDFFKGISRSDASQFDEGWESAAK